MNWDFADPYTERVIVEADAIDRLRHVNNARYLEYMEQTAWRHTEWLGLSWDDYERLDCAPVAHRHEVDYLKPAFEGDVLVVGTWCIGNDGKLRLRRQYQIIREGDGATLVRATTDWICVGLSNGRPRRMPPEFVEAYRPVADAPAYP